MISVITFTSLITWVYLPQLQLTRRQRRLAGPNLIDHVCSLEIQQTWISSSGHLSCCEDKEEHIERKIEGVKPLEVPSNFAKFCGNLLFINNAMM